MEELRNLVETDDVNSTKMITNENKPKVNVLDRDQFLTRAREIFQTYEDVLSKTLGAYGSPTIISNYPYLHITKDGYTVCRNMEFDGRGGELIDQTISLMAMNICSRLNYSVGDGTTSAIVATNELYKAIYEMMYTNDVFKHARPKDIMATFNEIKDELVKMMEEKATPVNSDNMEEVIRKIVHVSSNGDDHITEMITDAYKTLGFPAINCAESDTDETYCKIIDGFSINVYLGDKIYINNDEKTAKCKQCDVIMFDHKVSLDTYTYLIRPLTSFVRHCGRHLICIAPSYDETMLNGVIKRELMTEFEKTHDICLVLTAIQLNNNFSKKQYADLAVILGTTLIDRDLEDEMCKKCDEVNDIRKIFDMSDRCIPGITIYPSDSTEQSVAHPKVYDETRKNECMITLGFVEEASLGLKTSMFRNSFYNKEIYDKCIREAEMELDEVIQKFAILGTYTRDIYEAQKRLSSIRMKMATIYVGGDSDVSRNLLKDSVEDSIRAAESAFQNGYVQGCNFTLSTCIQELYDKEVDNNLREALLSALLKAFQSVYKKVLDNAFGEDATVTITTYHELFESITNYGIHIDEDWLECVSGLEVGKSYHLSTILIKISKYLGMVLNLDTMEFSNDVINSAKTDIEILTATSDLLSMLMVGNQVVMASYNHMKSM